MLCPTLSFVKKIESPNIMRYNINDEERGDNFFNEHSDNWSMETASRQISLILYLNDVEEGGSTTFTKLDKSVKPKKGSILMFPSFYLYHHKGEAPISNNKYIIVVWLHFDGVGHKFRVGNLY